MPSPFWYNLISSWIHNGFGSGLTLPYIIGAITMRSKVEASSTSIALFINEAVSTRCSNIVSVKACPDINETVFCLFNRHYKISAGIYLSDNFHIAQSMINKATTEAQLKSFCINEYSEQILEKTFSLKKSRWKSFDHADYAFINRVPY